MMEPYVSEKISWGIRYHQALRFFPDHAVGYEYPEMYNQIFGKDYVPPPYIKQAYEYARNHKQYMDARMITVHDLYAFDPTMKVLLDPFIDIIGRHFKRTRAETQILPGRLGEPGHQPSISARRHPGSEHGATGICARRRRRRTSRSFSRPWQHLHQGWLGHRF